MEDRELINAKFEHALQVHELIEEFLESYETRAELNQPTFLDFADWLADECRRLADQLGMDLDEDIAQAE